MRQIKWAEADVFYALYQAISKYEKNSSLLNNLFSQLHLNPDLIDEIRRLKVKLAKAKSINATGFAVSTSATVMLRDSVLFDTIQNSYFDYDDGFFRVRGRSIGNQQHLDLGYHDTLVQLVYWGERERPWLWIFSRRKLMQRVSLKNPNASITFSEYIQIADPQ
jgi:hypothetical protein